jgi:serine/threonine-protein kinase RsbW
MNTACSSNHKRASQLMLAGIQRSLSLLELEAWMPSEIGAISPTVEQLMRIIEPWRCIEGNEFAVEMALREALSNAVIHGNELDPDKLVEVRCRCERGKGVWLIVKDHGNGFDPTAIPDPLASQGLEAEHGRGIHLMKFAMDEVSFKRSGTEVHMRKVPSCKSRTDPPNDKERVSPDSVDSIECDATAAVREC